MSLATVRQTIVRTDSAPARIASLRCGGWKNSLRYLRCSSVEVEAAAQEALKLGRPTLSLPHAILPAKLPELIRESKISHGLIPMPKGLSYLVAMTLFEEASFCVSVLIIIR